MTKKPSAWMRDDDDEPMDRDEFAMQMYHLLEPPGPLPDDRVRLYFPDGTSVEGVMNFIAAEMTTGIVTDDGRAFTSKPPGVRLQVLSRALQRAVVLSENEASVVVGLLEELGGVYHGEAISGLAKSLAQLICDRADL